MSAKGIFITGTDTGAGKTIAAATIARLLQKRGMKVGVMKPVSSGCIERGGKMVSEDAELLKWAASGAFEDADVAPYRLIAPLAPSKAASLEGVRIDLSLIKDAYLRLAATCDFMVVEGVGGLMVPLIGGMLVADLVRLLELPIIVTARPNLGTVNHTVLTTFAARQLDIRTVGIIINNFPESPDAAEESAPHLIASLSGAPVLGIFPRREGSDSKAIVEQLAAELDGRPETDMLLRELTN